MIRNLQRILATTDVHSAFDDALPLLTHLHAARSEALIVDSGDFFEGGGYYRLGRGRVEREILTTLYDVIAPGNHGWPHYFEPSVHQLTVCANVVDDASGDALFRRIHLARVDGRRVAVTGVMGIQAFNAVPFADRVGHRVTDPVRALQELMLAHRHEVDAWILLSHSGFSEDLKIAGACPFLDVVFAGHCHSGQYGPVRVGNTQVLKGRELAVGYALAEPAAGGWKGRSHLLPPAATGSLPGLAPILGEIENLRRQLAAPLGAITHAYQHRLPNRGQLLAEVAGRLHTGLGAEAVLLNETALRPVPLHDTLTVGALLATEPFDNQLVHVVLPDDQPLVASLLGRLYEQVGPLATAPDPLPSGTRSVLTTDYLADAYFGGHPRQAVVSLRQAVQHVLTDGGGS
ncbi:metallophosphoesterase [Streptomyces sp. NPDC056358]|uniref:metallophosphoesterase n=1 Tax=Streptomyces sp. NPDC056358 TaxID=3345794 RepID=UPI0035DD12C2